MRTLADGVEPVVRTVARGERIVAVGNAAGEGAKISLLSFREREAASRIPELVEYVELSGRPEFNDIFTEALAFPVRTVESGTDSRAPH